MDKRHAGFLEGEYEIQQQIVQEKQKVWELEQKRKMFAQRHKAFDEVAEAGPYVWGFDQIFQDPYYNPFPQEQPADKPAEKPADSKPAEKPADAKPEGQSTETSSESQKKEKAAQPNYYPYEQYY